MIAFEKSMTRRKERDVTARTPGWRSLLVDQYLDVHVPERGLPAESVRKPVNKLVGHNRSRTDAADDTRLRC